MDRRRPRTLPARPLVLLVEDDEETRALHVVALAADGFDVVPVADGSQAYRRAWMIHPDVVVADLSMSNLDEWQFLRNMKGDPRTRGIPVVAVSAYGQLSGGEQGTRGGFTAWLPKSCPPDELASGLRQVLDLPDHARRS